MSSVTGRRVPNGYGSRSAGTGDPNFTDLYFVPWGDIAAASVVVTVPLVVLVLIFQRRIVAGLTAGAVKE